MLRARKWWIIAAALVVAVAAAAFPWSNWDESITRQLARQVRHTTGLELKTSERVTVALLPRPHIKFRAVSIRDRWGTLQIDTEILKGNLRLLPLLTGRLEVSSLSLILPTIALNVHGRPLHDRGAIARASTAAKASPQARDADETRLATISIAGGRMLVRDGNKKTITQVGDINATLDWAKIKSPAAFSGGFIWRGEKVSLEAMIKNPGQLLRKQASPIAVDFRSRLLNLKLDGSATKISGWQFQGKLTASSTAIRPLLSVTGTQWPLPAPISSIAVDGHIKARPTAISLTNLKLNIDGVQFSGALALLERDKRQVVTATLATDDLNIDHRATNFPRLISPDGKWNSNPLPLKPLALVDLDLRLSAKNASFDNFRASDVALIALARSGSLELSIVAPQAYGGNFRANLKLDQGPALPAISGAVNFRSIDMKSLLDSTKGRLRMTGSAEGEIQFRSAGNNFAEIANLLSGSVRFNLARGSIAGLDIVKGLSLAKTLPLSLPDAIRLGSTPLEKAYVHAKIKDGRLRVTDARLDSGPVHSKVSGEISLPTRALKLSIKAQLKPQKAGAAPHPASTLELDVVGPWRRPSIMPNLESLIKRSKAAESLFTAPAKTSGEKSAIPAAKPPAPKPSPASAPEAP